METGQIPVQGLRRWKADYNGMGITIFYNPLWDDIGIQTDEYGFILCDDCTGESSYGLEADRTWVGITDEFWFVLNYSQEDDSLTMLVREARWSDPVEVTPVEAE